MKKTRLLKLWGLLIPILLIAAVLSPFTLIACKQEPVEHVDLEEVRIQTMWVPNAQFAGYYVAIEKGYYRDEGLKVSFNEYDEGVAVKDVVAEGGAEFGIDGADQVIVARSEGKPLVAVAVHYRLNPTAYASLKEKGIKRPEDLVGKKIGILPDNTGTIFKAMIRKHGLSESDMEFIEYGYDFGMLYSGTVDLIPIYIFDEPYIMMREGYELNIILPEDYGIHAYGDTLFTTEQLVRERPDLVLKLVRATLKGWQYAIENPQAAVDIVLKYDDPDYNDKEYETFILTNEAPLVHTGEDYIGWMRQSVWQDMHDMLLEHELIKQPVDIQEVYTMKFLNEIYGK